MNEHQEFFERLLNETKKAYQASEIKKDNLYYSVCATPLFKNSTLLLGFNWGAGQNQKYDPQTRMEVRPFTQLDLGSLKRTFGFFHKYLPDAKLDEFVQSNLCFFRSKKEADISQGDLLLSQGLFESLINYIQPKEVISFSNQLYKYVSSQNKLVDESHINIISGKKTFQSRKAKLDINGQLVPISFLPHPNYPITNMARNDAWKYCFGKPID
jgi:hypothetical protein